MGSKGKKQENIMQAATDPAEALQQAQARVGGRRGVAEALAQFGQGGMSIQDALEQARAGGLGRGDAKGIGRLRSSIDSMRQKLARGEGNKEERAFWGREIAKQSQQLQNMQAGAEAETGAFLQQLATDPLAGSQFAEQQVMRSGLTRGLFGDDSMQSRLAAEEARLAGEGFGLTESDREAMAQAGGDITRQYGQQEANLAQTLAARGLGGSPAAAAAFTGLGGSKMEQLARMQTQIAREREDRAQQRLSQARQQMMNLGQLGQQAQSAQFGRQLAGRQQTAAERDAAARQSFARQQAIQQQKNKQFEQKESTRGPGVGGIVGGMLGTGLGALAGGAGAGIGGSLGSTVGSVFDSGGGGKK